MAGFGAPTDGDVVRRRLLVEIFEGDPFEGCCAPLVVPDSTVRELRSLLAHRQAIVNSLKNHFAGRIQIGRTVLSRKRPADSYPECVRPYLGKVNPPAIF